MFSKRKTRKTRKSFSDKTKTKSKSKKNNSTSFSSFVIPSLSRQNSFSRKSSSKPPSLSRQNSFSRKSSSKPPSLSRQNSFSRKSSSKPPSLSRQNSFSSVYLVEKDDFTLKEYVNDFKGIKQHRYLKLDKNKINTQQKICKNIKSSHSLSDKITSYFKNINISNEQQDKLKFYLFPYCNEEIKGTKNISKLNTFLKKKAEDALLYIDQVNNPSIYNKTKIALENRLNLTLSPTSSEIKEKEGRIYSGENNPELFLNEVKKLKNNQIIISHSEFMTEFYKFLTKNLLKDEILKYFDNLDAIQLLIDKNTETIDDFYIRRWENNYKIEKEKEENMIEKYIENNNLISVIIIRHCVGCHNITPGLSNKLKQTAKNVVFKNQKGFLKNAMCLELTVDEMKEKGPYLLDILNKYGGFKNYNFGSSVIFRAILTGGLYYHILNHIHNNL